MIKRLAWDSGFFGYEVGMTKVEGTLEIEQFHKEAQNYQLVYIYSQDPLSNLPDSIKHFGTKVTFQKMISVKEKSFQFPFFSEVDQLGGEGICELLGKECLSSNSPGIKKKSPVYDALTDLAIISGKFSHYKLDRRLKNMEFERLYIQWILNAVVGKERLFVYVKKGKIGGLITLFLKQKYGRIGLLAVTEKLRGEGIGAKLLGVAGEIAGQEKVKILEVGTQKKNLPAMALYQRNGFRVSDEKEIYHFANF